ncbi:MAG: MBOAT family O-acyltransferase [Thermodesulfobacteriota bacterium]
MHFTDAVFFFFFLATYVAFVLARKTPRGALTVLLTASLLFCAWSKWDFVGLLLLSSVGNYLLGIFVHEARNPGRKKAVLIVGLASNLVLLGVFKYFNWFADGVNDALGAFGVNAVPFVKLSLPLGISFYTFQCISYLVDIYRGGMLPCRSILKFLLFVAFFPKLIAGPIARAASLIPQFGPEMAGRSDSSGLWLVLYGLMKKLALADPIGAVLVDPAFADPSRYSSVELLLAAHGFAFEIFLDFSAYSDIAIGLGRLFGVELPVNFRWPYLATNPREFWRGWHITFSTWLRDYLYIPLGGSRGTRWETARNLLFTMILGGLWHGAGVNFLVWGLLHGLYLCANHEFDLLVGKGRFKWWGSVPRFVRVALFCHVVSLTWVFFRSPGIVASLDYLACLVSNGWGCSHITRMWALLLGAAVAVHFAVEPALDKGISIVSRLPAFVCAACYMVFFTWIYSSTGSESSTRQFIYAQF